MSLEYQIKFEDNCNAHEGFRSEMKVYDDGFGGDMIVIEIHDINSGNKNYVPSGYSSFNLGRDDMIKLRDFLNEMLKCGQDSS